MRGGLEPVWVHTPYDQVRILAPLPIRKKITNAQDNGYHRGADLWVA
jgi:hypothetical protein